MTDALPYIKKMNNKTIVIKYGGNAMIDDNLKQCVMNDMVLLSLVGINVVLVHGGGPEINEMLAKVGKQSKFINGLRYTDRETVDIVQMVLAGRVNKDLVRLLENAGGKAVGLCGLDGSMIKAVKKAGSVDLGFVGAGISSRLCDKKCIAAGDWAEVTRRASVFTEITKQHA